LAALHGLVNDHRVLLVGRWNEYFGNQS
jgi:hypothetical protein